MRITVVGGGPAGLYFAALMKRADPSHEITVLERNAPDATFGWGVVFSEETLGSLRDADRPSYDEITEMFARWGAIDVRYRGETVRSRGHVFSAIARVRLLSILQRRCADLGVELRFEHEVSDLSGLAEAADLVVGADGVNSTVRAQRAEALGPTLDVHRTRYIWFGTHLALKAFTFIFRENEHGLFQVHGYPFDARTSTFIVECPEWTWRRAGLDRATEQESIAYCEELFAEDLAGHRLLSNRSMWLNFVTLRNGSWRDGNVVLVGDAAHTAHFTIGSGTKLAMEDAVALAEALERHPGPDLTPALVEYELARQPVIERFQQAALESSAYFENVRRYAGFEPVQFAFNLLTRSGRITHLELEKRDPSFVAGVDDWFARNATGSAIQVEPAGHRTVRVARAPAFTPLLLRHVDVTNRVTLSSPVQDRCEDGVPGDEHTHRAEVAAASGAGLVIPGSFAVSAEARIRPGSLGLYAEAHAAAWRWILDRARHLGEARFGATIGHAGRRGATRPRTRGVDIPLEPDDAWPLVSASPLPYTSRSAVPRELSVEEMPAIVAAFARAARLAAGAGFDLLELDLARGHLLASFLSPLSNRRADEYGGSLDDRLRFPLRVVEAVREAWPERRPLAVRLTATDWMPGGFEVDEAVAVAERLKSLGCDLVHVVAGQTVRNDRPEYGRFALVPASDRIRNEAGICTLVGGHLTTMDEVNTILAAGRADLCILDPPVAAG